MYCRLLPRIDYICSLTVSCVCKLMERDLRRARARLFLLRSSSISIRKRTRVAPLPTLLWMGPSSQYQAANVQHDRSESRRAQDETGKQASPANPSLYCLLREETVHLTQRSTGWHIRRQSRYPPEHNSEHTINSGSRLSKSPLKISLLVRSNLNNEPHGATENTHRAWYSRILIHEDHVVSRASPEGARTERSLHYVHACHLTCAVHSHEPRTLWMPDRSHSVHRHYASLVRK